MLIITSITVFTLLFFVVPSACIASDWEYGEGFREELLYLHSVINYNFDPDWQQDWEKELMRGKGMKVSFGSIAKEDLLHDEELIINQPMGKGWWFRTRLNLYESRHEDKERFTRYLEFQKKIFGDVYMCVSSDLKHEKAEIDGAFGFMFTDDSREKYTQIQFVWDDLLYDKRNKMRGDTKRFPLGAQWLIRWGGNKWILFSEGKYSNGFSRDYYDMKLSPVSYHHEQQFNHANWKLTYFQTQHSRIEAQIRHYRFDEYKRFYQLEKDYSYLNEINRFTLRYLFSASMFDQVRLELHAIRQYSRADGYKNYRYKRHEYMPALFVKRNLREHTLELGYFSSVYGWDYDDIRGLMDYVRNDYIDKLRLGWTYHFNEKTRIHLTLSHVLEIKRFGGGSGQFMVLF